MSLEPYRFLSGILLEYLGGRISRRDIERAKFDFVRNIASSPWEEFVFHSPQPLIGELADSTSNGYPYRAVCRRSGSRLLLLAQNKDLVEYLLDNHLADVFVPRLRQIPIAVDNLVREVVNKPSLYSLTRVYARVPGYGQILRSISYYGDDLGEATMFREQMKELSFFLCGLRNAVEGHELLRLGNDGTVSFFLAQPEGKRVREIEKVLTYLRQNDYLDIVNESDDREPIQHVHNV